MEEIMKASFTLPKTTAGTILALAEVELVDGIIVKGFRILRKDAGIVAAVPSRSFTVAGKTQWMNQVAFESSEVRKRFLETLVDEYHRWQRRRERAPEKAGTSHSPTDELVE
jgi:DNA-binding cell septation regulator SpoVG